MLQKKIRPKPQAASQLDIKTPAKEDTKAPAQAESSDSEKGEATRHKEASKSEKGESSGGAGEEGRFMESLGLLAGRLNVILHGALLRAWEGDVSELVDAADVLLEKVDDTTFTVSVYSPDDGQLCFKIALASSPNAIAKLESIAQETLKSGAAGGLLICRGDGGSLAACPFGNAKWSQGSGGWSELEGDSLRPVYVCLSQIIPNAPKAKVELSLSRLVR